MGSMLEQLDEAFSVLGLAGGVVGPGDHQVQAWVSCNHLHRDALGPLAKHVQFSIHK